MNALSEPVKLFLFVSLLMFLSPVHLIDNQLDVFVVSTNKQLKFNTFEQIKMCLFDVDQS